MLAVLLSVFALTSDAWLQDFQQLMDEMSSHYANLDSAIDDRKMDLPDLRRRTVESLKKAKSDEEARQALDSFMRAFGDGHASIDWRPQSSPSAADTPKTLCERLRYRAREDTSGIDFARLREFTPTRILKLSGDRRVGVIRILLFSHDIHPQLCQAAMKTLSLTDESACDFECEIRVQRAVSDLLTADLERQLEALRSAGATAILVDLTGNGGGTDWVEAAARVLTPVALQSQRLGFIRHPHWEKQLQDRLNDVEHDLAAGAEPGEPLLKARAILTRSITKAAQTCDRSGVWLDQPKRPDCSLVVSDSLFASGVMSYAKPGSVSEGWAKTTLFRRAEFSYREGVNRLPLYVLVDQRTASASEQFTALMQDNKAATIVGQHTRGAGCGHTNGGIPTTLKNSGARVALPDCARFRADGSNEVVGIAPDLLIPWSTFDSRYQRAAKMLRVLEGLVR